MQLGTMVMTLETTYFPVFYHRVSFWG